MIQAFDECALVCHMGFDECKLSLCIHLILHREQKIVYKPHLSSFVNLVGKVKSELLNVNDNMLTLLVLENDPKVLRPRWLIPKI